MTSAEKKAWAFSRVKRIVDFAQAEIPFYQRHYANHGFRAAELQSFDDIGLIPSITKSDLLACPLEERSSPLSGRYLVNTGGSSGKTLSLFITPDAMGHEWAHMHQVWGLVGYQPSDLKLTFGGHYSGTKIADYDSVRHQFNINIYKKYDTVKDKLTKLFSEHEIKFLHGYPSAIYDFAVFCSEPVNSDLLFLVNANLKGILLGSEYPAPHWRAFIEQTFQTVSVSWYGHTERAVLAYESEEKYRFNPFLSYGFVEGVEKEDGCHLLGTSYYNFASPLIRYDTEDLIKPFYSEGLLNSFEIKEGRNGEFILDRSGGKIPLTGLIFGRHHALFDLCQFIQITQSHQGEAQVLYVPLPGLKVTNPSRCFNSEGIAVVFSFLELTEPVRTTGGKVKLLVKSPHTP